MKIKASKIKVGTPLAESDRFLWDVAEIIRKTPKAITNANKEENFIKRVFKYTTILLVLLIGMAVTYFMIYVDSATYTIVSVADGCAIGTSPEGFQAAYSAGEYQIGDTVTTYIGFNPLGASDDILFRLDR